MNRPRSSAWPLAAACLCLVVYASLHPFSGWTVPPGGVAWRLPVPPGLYRFDLVANLLGYLPLGALLALALLRDGASSGRTLLIVLGFAIGLSYAMECLQQLLPRRVPSALDWTLNSAGAALGVLAVLVIDALGGLAGWQRWRERWFLRGRGFGLALLLLWPFGLLFPPPLPFGLGHGLDRARAGLDGLLAGTAWDGWLGARSFGRELVLAPGVELLAIVAGLLAPCLLAAALTRPGLRRAVLLAGALVLGVAVQTLSTALNFGPDHALTWVTAPVGPAIWIVIALLLPLALLPPRIAAALGLLALALLIALVNAAPSDPYYAASLQAWEQGRFIRFHGLSQWLGWLWPWAALVCLVGRVAARDEGRET